MRPYLENDEKDWLRQNVDERHRACDNLGSIEAVIRQIDQALHQAPKSSLLATLRTKLVALQSSWPTFRPR